MHSAKRVEKLLFVGGVAQLIFFVGSFYAHPALFFASFSAVCSAFFLSFVAVFFGRLSLVAGFLSTVSTGPNTTTAIYLINLSNKPPRS